MSGKSLKPRSKPKAQLDDCDDFIVEDDIKYRGYQSKSEEEDLNQAIEDAPMIQSTKSKVKLDQLKVQELFEQKEDSDEDYEELMARSNKKPNQGILAQDNLDPSQYDKIMESSRARVSKTASTPHRQSDALNLPKTLSANQAIQRFNGLEQTIQVYMTQIYQFPSDRTKLCAFGTTDKGQKLNIYIKDMEKCMYFIVREGEDDQQKIQDEIRLRLNQSGIVEFDGEFQKMNYVFQLQGVPRGDINTYKVRYPFSTEVKNGPTPAWEGKYFKYVIGTTYTALQLFVVKNKIKGPQWVQIQKKYLQLNTKVNSTIGLAVDYFVPETIVTPEDLDKIKIPKLGVMSVAVKYAKPGDIRRNLFPATAPKDKQTIYCITLQYCPNYNIQFKTKNLQLDSVVFILKSFGLLPQGQFKKTKVVICENQMELLNRFMGVVEGFDPDIVACHDSTTAIQSIISRLQHLNVKETWKLSRLGPNRQSLKNGNLRQRLGVVFAGRLLVDTYFHAKDLLKLIDYSLPFISAEVPIKQFSQIRNEQANSMLTSGEWVKLVLHSLEQSQGVFNLMNHLEVVQLTRQLTNICGNLWRRSLENLRAERNQYLMMHQCQLDSMIIPDKFYRDRDEEAPKHQKFQGGFVIEPVKDLYTEYILLLDFNSLYPSIIREYNICFSKVKRNLLPLSKYYKPKVKTQNKMQVEQQAKIDFVVQVVGEEARSRQQWGFLPNLIHSVVSMRNVFKKKMMNLPKESVDQKMAFDITQKAYKLVANSIYGCLGFSQSRFYAKDLASLITQMGRKALKRARQLVEKQGRAEVIYGDTDSLMIRIDMQQGWSEVQKVKHVFLVAQKLKQDINNQYRNKMLEIDIDGVFKPLNLIAKKKYMAKKLDNFDQVRLTGAAPVFSVEYKGIQVAKRDGCQKARQAIRDVFAIVLNNMLRIDDAATQIYDYFGRLHEEMINMNPEKDYKKYVLNKILNKHPNLYKQGAQNLAHIRVAKRLIEKGQKAEKLINHAIYYVIVKSDNEKDSAADRAVDDATFFKSLKTLTPMKIDIDYYKVHEILPPIFRVLVNIKNIQKSYINERFHIDKKHRNTVQRLLDDNQDREVETPYLITKDTDTPVNSVFQELKCPGDCNRKYPFCSQGKLISQCQDSSCDYSKQGQLVPLAHNMILNYIYLKTINLYNPVYKCRTCHKKWLVQVKACCGQSKFQRNCNAAQLHNVLYLLLKITTKMALLTEGKKSKSPIQQLRKTISRVLKASQFQTIEKGFMASLRVQLK